MNELELKKREMVNLFLKKNILLSPEILKNFEKESDAENLYSKLAQAGQNVLIHPVEVLSTFPDEQKPEDDGSAEPVKIILEYEREGRKISSQDFIDHFNSRYRTLEKILKGRQELKNTISIARVLNKSDKEEVSIIGMVYDKRETKNGNIILVLEDGSGEIKVIISKTKHDLMLIAKDIVLDEVIGVTGANTKDVVFANSIVLPDVPFATDLKKSPDEAYAVAISDIHVGSSKFLEKEFKRFIRWLNGQEGNEEQKAVAEKVRYVFVVGDVVDGVGIYPSQEESLEIKDIYEQYNICADLLSQIPKRIKLIICPGNHDALRLAEPQPRLPRDYAKPMWDLPNAVMVGNPAYINIHASKNFPGFNILMYHGYSFDDYGEIVESIKNSGKHISDRAPYIMRFLLQRRHLAPTHSTTLYVPDSLKDPLVIDPVPDIFIAGHIHKAASLNYRGVTIICSSCWQGKTDFQEKVGHDPEPCRVPVINLKTMDVKIINFS